MKNSLLLLIISILFIGCNPDIFNLRTKACFDYSPTNNLKTSDTIKFSNCSVNSNYYYWDFGDGNYSYEKEPKHKFRLKQSYCVKLFVANRPENDPNNIQESDTIIKIINISVGVAKANYWYKHIVGSKMAFFNISDYSTKCFWDFGDGNISTDENPIHSYIHSGSYNVKLRVSDGSEFDSINKTIEVNDTVDLKNINVTDNNNIDCDGDGIPDLNFKTMNARTTSSSWQKSQITPLNDFELFTDSATAFRTITSTNSSTTTTESVTIPKIYLLGDTISNTNSYTKTALNIAYSSTYFGVTFNSYGYNIWIKDEFRYIGFRKVIKNKINIGWIKLKVLDYYKIILISYKNPCETESLLIDK